MKQRAKFILVLNSLLPFYALVLNRTSITDDGAGNILLIVRDADQDTDPLQIQFNTREVGSMSKNRHYKMMQDCSTNNRNLCRKYKNKFWLTVDADISDSRCQTILYTTFVGNCVKASIKLGWQHLYGGAEHYSLKWPAEKMNYKRNSYVTKVEFYQAVLEPYWLTSHGYTFYVPEGVPLFISSDPAQGVLELSAEHTYPYLLDNYRPNRTDLKFIVCKFQNMKLAHMDGINKYIGKPASIPDVERVKQPIWSTWARHKDKINRDVVMKYAEEIYSHGFSGQLEIDDHWESCYGSLTPDLNKFPDMRLMVQEIKKKYNLRVALWVHPFVNVNCDPTHRIGEIEKYFVKNSQMGQITMQWWRGNASYIDFTNPAAAEWYRNRLVNLMNEYDIDGLKFDGGESAYAPQPSTYYQSDQSYPETITKEYVALIASLGKNVHTRVARRTQKYPIFVTMMDRDSRWDNQLGLNTLVPQLLQFNLLGYSNVLPDMIGGNFYQTRASSELFIRWVQANTFMPSMQFSVPPWDYDRQVTKITRKFVNLHAKYANRIISLMKRNSETGKPVNPPLWWIAPTDQEAQVCDSEFLLGEDLLIAPVLDEGAVSRDIYIPEGCWKDENKNILINGPRWLRKYPADISTLPFFSRVGVDQRHSNGIINTVLCVVESDYTRTYFDFFSASIVIIIFVIFFVLYYSSKWFRIRRRLLKCYF